jgi:hypothetical protein
MDAKQNEVMVTYYIYEVPGKKNGATIDWKGRSKYNFKRWGIQPIIIETMEGPDTPEMWKIVGDREWELADANGYKRGRHYLKIRNTAPSIGKRRQGGRTQGRRNVESGQLAAIVSIGGTIGGKASFAGPNHNTKQKVKCPYCDKVTTPPGLGTHLKFKHKKRTAN